MIERRLSLPALRFGLRGWRFGLMMGGALLLGFVVLGLSPLFVDIAPPAQIDLLARLAGPSDTHPLGTDHLGRDVLSRLIHAVPVSLGAAFAPMLAILAIALPWGVIAAVAGANRLPLFTRNPDDLTALDGLVEIVAV